MGAGIAYSTYNAKGKKTDVDKIIMMQMKN